MAVRFFLALNAPGGSLGGYNFTYTDGFNNFDAPGGPFPSGVTLPLNPTVTTTTTFNYSLIKVTDEATLCEGTTALQLSGSATLTVNPLPTATISVDNATVCLNGTTPNVTITGANGTAPYTFSYTVNGVPQTITSEDPGSSVSIPVSTSTSGTFTFILTNVQDASSTQCQQIVTGQQVSVLVRDLTAITTDVTSPDAICLGGTAPVLSVIASGAHLSYTWYSNNDNITPNGTPVTNGSGGTTANFTPDVSIPGTYYYYVIVSGDCGSATSFIATVIITPNASVGSVTGTSPLCIGGSTTQYSANNVVLGGGTASWSSSDPTVATVDQDGNVTTLKAGTTNITYTITGGCNGTPSAFQTLIVTPNASVGSVTGTSPLCIGGSTTQYSANNVVLGGGTASWSSSDPTVATVDQDGNVTTLKAGTTNITYTITGGCNGTPSAFQTLIVTPNASVESVTGTSPLCIGGSTTQYSANNVVLGGGTASWSSSDPTVATVDQDGNVTTLKAGTTNITYTITGGCNGTPSAFQTLIVTPNASVESVTGTSPLCIGGSTTQYSANNVVLGGGTASWSSSDPTVATVDQDGNVTTLKAGTTNITYTITGGCNGTPSAFQTLIVTPNASVGSVTGTSPLCIGGSTTQYSANNVVLGGGTASWSSSDPTVATVDQDGNVTTLKAGTTNITYTITGGCNGTPSAFQTLTVTPNASVESVTGTSPLCIGGSTTQYSANNVVLGGGTASWSSSDPTVATVDQDGNVTTLKAGTTNITYTIITGGCNGTPSAFQTLIVTPNASVESVTGTSPLCIGGSTTQYSANNVVLGGGTASWSSSDPTVATVDQDGNVTTLKAGTTNITYTITGGCNGTPFAFQTLIVTPNASVGSVTGTSPLCIGGSTTQYSANNVVLGGGTASWSSSDPTVATVDQDGNVTTLKAGTTNITYTITGGCNGTPSAFQTLIVTPNASVGSVTGTSPLCIGGSTTQYSANNVVLGGGTASWSSSDPTVATVDQDGNVTTLKAGTTNITYTITGGCNGTPSAFKTLTVTPNASVASVSGTATLCTGTTTTYTANSVVLGGGTGSWSSGDITIATVDPVSGLVTAIAPGTTNITFTINGGCNGTPSAHQSITVSLNTTISSNPSGYMVCLGGTATQLKVTAAGAGTLHYQWYSNTTNSTLSGSPVGTDASTFTPDVSNAGTTYYYVVVTGDCAAITSTVAAVKVNPIPTITQITETDIKCFNDVNGTVTVTVNGGTPGYNYTLSSTTTSFTSTNTTGSFTGLAADNYNVIVTDANGCSAATGNTTVGAPAKLTAGFTTTDITCFNANDGTATITASGGTGFYHYSIDGHSSVPGDNLISKKFTGLVPGPHGVVVTDDNGCSTSLITFTINQPTQLTAVASAGTLSCNNSTTSLFVIANGGTPPYMYSLNGGAPQSGFVFTVGANPSYIVTVTDAHNCTVNTAFSKCKRSNAGDNRILEYKSCWLRFINGFLHCHSQRWCRFLYVQSEWRRISTEWHILRSCSEFLSRNCKRRQRMYRIRYCDHWSGNTSNSV